MAQSLKLVIDLESNAEGKLQATALMVNQVATAAKRDLGGMGDAAKKAGDNVISLSDKIKHFVKEERSEMRTAGFLTREISEIVPMSGHAKAALTQLGGALIGGSPLMLGVSAAIAGFLLLKTAIHGVEEAEKKAIETGQKYIEHLAKLKTEGAGKAAAAQYQLALQGAGSAEGRATVENAKRLRDAQENLRVAMDARRALSIDDPNVGPGQWTRVKAEADARVLAARNELTAVADLNAKLLEKAQIEDRDKARSEADKSQKEINEKHYRAMSEQARLWAEAEKNKAEAIARAKREGMEEARGMTGFEEEGERNKDYQALKNRDLGDAERAQKKIADAAEKTREAYQRWGDTAADVLASIIMKQQTMAEALRSIGSMILRSALAFGINAGIAAVLTPAAAPAVAPAAGGVIGGTILSRGGMTVNIAAVDSKSVDRLFREEGGGLVRSLERQARRRRF